MNSTKQYLEHFLPFIFVSLVLSFSLSIIAPNAASAANQYDLFAKSEWFTWKEFSGGRQLLKESGCINGIGASAKLDIFERFTIKNKDDLYMGRVNYDGQLQDGTPYKTDTDYKGFRVEVDGGWKILANSNSSFEAFIGAGGRRWTRELLGSGSVSGYKETWTSIFSRLGIRGDYTSVNKVTTFAEAGILLPIDNKNEVDNYPGVGNFTVKPDSKPSYFAEAGLLWKAAKASLFYEGMRFSKSDPVTVGAMQFIQPESEADMVGVNIGVSF